MDGAMQLYFKHGVPKVLAQKFMNKPRLAIVFWRGQQKLIKSNSGQPVTSLAPRGNAWLSILVKSMA
jgi:hypothetical protein